jgi:protein-L-isoaspartate O-methyltransferase
LKNWERAHCSQVVAIEKDSEMVNEAKNKLGNAKVPIELIESDVMSAKTWEKLSSFDTVFCNFSIHYLAGKFREYPFLIQR